ncbi:MAG: Lrp/AsnC family transcriptional regulator [Candidatus Odinarchaeum yellowstonii]|uniref:Lrp/AsnC family transcriptional regulator n=1 Tax=Odinarchaeota yellowstonii (strain LCB_4) TaxID=1841599 RepID=A0AAF0D2A9_ODILC|nr:MAG: Lrp/AsnC family transcriptional regulator [Candidatus Odinarchaeum yellowstonii]
MLKTSFHSIIETTIKDYFDKKNVWSEFLEPPVIFNMDQANLAREIFRRYVSKIIPETIIEDLEYLLLYKLSDKSLREKLLKEWCDKKNSDVEDATKITYEFDDGSCYRSVYDLILYDKITNGLFLPTILENLKKLEKYNYTLNLKDACHYIRLHSLLTYTLELDSTDIKIIELLSKDPLISNNEAASRLGLSRNTFANRLLRLQKRGCIFFNGRINLEKLGLKILTIMTDQQLPKLPYMRIVQELRGGSTVYLYSFNVPEGFLVEFIDLIKPYIRNAEYWIDEGPGRHSLSIRNSYDTVNKRWAFNWENWALWVRKVLAESWHTLYVSGDVEESILEEKSGSVKLDYDILDLELLNQLSYDFKQPIRDISLKLGVSPTTIYDRKTRLISSGVIKPTLFVENIGLDEHVFIKIKGSEKIINSVESGLLDLPSVYIFRVRNLRGEKALNAYLFLPKGSLVMVDYTLKNYLEDIGEEVDFKLFYRLKQNYLSQGLPFTFENGYLYKEDFKKWVFPQKTIIKIFKGGS